MVHGRLVEKEPNCYCIRLRDGRVMPTVAHLTDDTRHANQTMSASLIAKYLGQNVFT
jgi:hypothetical protein